MSGFKVVEHKSGLQEIVNPIAVYARDLRKRAFVVDTETTGAAGDDEVIELGVVRASDGEALFDRQFRPTKNVGGFAYQIHGISNAQLAGKPTIGDLWHEIYALLDGAICVAWNAPQDSRFLNQTMRRYGLDEPRIEWVCVMKLYRDWRQLPRACKLEDACRAMKVGRGNHRALNDALAAARILYRMAESAPDDEVITFSQASEDEGGDETAMTARDFLREFDWREKVIAEVGAREVESRWIDPMSGQEVAFSAAMDLQRARM